VTHRWLGWLGVAALVTVARAAPSSAPPHLARHGERVPADATAAKPKAIATAVRPSEPHALDAGKLTGLTDDPALGKADRIDGDEARGMVAFTFDDGPNPETTPAVIDALEKYNVPAAFFIITQRLAGKHGEHSRELLQRELAAGFLVGSHSVTHPTLKHASSDLITREIDGSIRTLAANANRPVGMFRAPYGALNAAGRMRLKKLGLTEVFWSVDTLDWRAHSPERLRKKVMSMIKKDGGGVVLMHDVKPITAKIIADVLDDLEAENCTRLADGREPIIPVSLHYFLKDGKTPREVPEPVKHRTEAYRAALPERCARRSPASPEAVRHAAK
jgi:peptidoglycan/xylan/chitin deacetylase (PgdA/CDA1 family)